MPNGVHLVVNDVHGKVTVVNDISLKIKFLLYESFTCDFSQLTKYFKKKKKKKKNPTPIPALDMVCIFVNIPVVNICCCRNRPHTPATQLHSFLFPKNQLPKYFMKSFIETPWPTVFLFGCASVTHISYNWYLKQLYLKCNFIFSPFLLLNLFSGVILLLLLATSNMR